MTLPTKLVEQTAPQRDEVAGPITGLPILVSMLVRKFPKVKAGMLGELVSSK